MKKLYVILLAAIIGLSSVNAQTAYITNNDDTTVSVINVATNTVTAKIKVSVEPGAVSVSPDGSKVYIANFGDYSVSVINSATNKVTNIINVGTQPSGIAVSPNGSRVYVACIGVNRVYITIVR
jgi:YVTN family beta-propeller protein